MDHVDPPPAPPASDEPALHAALRDCEAADRAVTAARAALLRARTPAFVADAAERLRGALSCAAAYWTAAERIAAKEQGLTTIDSASHSLADRQPAFPSRVCRRLAHFLLRLEDQTDSPSLTGWAMLSQLAKHLDELVTTSGERASAAYDLADQILGSAATRSIFQIGAGYAPQGLAPLALAICEAESMDEIAAAMSCKPEDLPSVVSSLLAWFEPARLTPYAPRVDPMPCHERATMSIFHSMPGEPSAALAPLALAICEAEGIDQAAEATLAYFAARNGAPATAGDMLQLVTGIRSLADALLLRAHSTLAAPG